MNKFLKIKISFFLIFEFVFYLSYLLIDLIKPDSSSLLIKFISVIICACMILVNYPVHREPSITAALTLTVLADYFLLILNRYFEVGVMIFIIVQLLYLFLIYKYTRKIKPWMRLLTVLFLCLILFLFNMASLLNILCAVYFSLFVWNLFLSFSDTTRRGRLLSFGMSLFMLCDINVGLYNIISSTSTIYPLIGFSMWFFYLPGIVLITLSAFF